MATLADLFGEEYRSGKVRPGTVVYMDVNFTDHPKYLLIACCTPICLVFVINSEVPPFIQRNQDLLDCQVDINKIDHEFLDHDSIINCVDVNISLRLTDITGAVNFNYRRSYKGVLKEYCVREVLLAVERTEVMSDYHKELVKMALDPYI